MVSRKLAMTAIAIVAAVAALEAIKSLYLDGVFARPVAAEQDLSTGAWHQPFAFGLRPAGLGDSRVDVDQSPYLRSSLQVPGTSHSPSGFGRQASGTAKQVDGGSTNVPSQLTYFDAVSYASAVNSAEDKVLVSERRQDVAALVVPHHLLASSIIARMFLRASGREVDTVFIIGPNHQDLGPDAIATADLRYETALGGVASDAALAAGLRSELGATGSAAPFMIEHSVGAIVPFSQHYFVNARVVPIIVSSFAKKDDIERLALWLHENSGPRTLTVFSIDFSHYLTEDEANRKDEETERAIRDRDIDQVMTFGNDHVDSPGSLAAALEYARLAGARIGFVEHANANDLLPGDIAVTTGYFGLMFTVAR